MKHINRRTFVQFAALAPAVFSSTWARATRRASRDLKTQICIIGAGASGMYGAVRLRELGYSVLVLEKTARVGGHSSTYRSADGPGHFDLGVRYFPDTTFVKEFFKKFDVELEKANIQDRNQSIVNFDTGNLSDYNAPSELETFFSIQKYRDSFTRTYNYLAEEGWNLPDPLPEELLQPFNQYIQDNQIGRGFSLFTGYLQGFGQIRKLTSLYALKLMRPSVVDNAVLNSYLMAKNGIEELYQKIAAQLGDSIILESNLESVRRDASGVRIELGTPDGRLLVNCDHLLLSCPPTLGNLSVFDLDENEKAIFGKFSFFSYVTAAVRVIGLPKKTLLNLTVDDPLNQKLPAIYAVGPTTTDGVVNVLYGSDQIEEEDAIKARIVADVERLSFKAVPNEVKVEGFELFLNHKPFALHVDPDEIRQGFYAKLNALQGLRNSIYLGAAVNTHESAAVWQHAEKLIAKYFPKIS